MGVVLLNVPGFEQSNVKMPFQTFIPPQSIMSRGPGLSRGINPGAAKPSRCERGKDGRDSTWDGHFISQIPTRPREGAKGGEGGKGGEQNRGLRGREGRQPGITSPGFAPHHKPQGLASSASGRSLEPGQSRV